MRVESTHIYLPMKMEQSVPKRRHINSRRRVITQKKAYNIQGFVYIRTEMWRKSVNCYVDI